MLVRERDKGEDVEELFQRSERERENVRDAALREAEGIAAKDDAITRKYASQREEANGK